jgi:parallel beta-helix repeat protein
LLLHRTPSAVVHSAPEAQVAGVRRRSRRLLLDPFVAIAIALTLLTLATFAFTGLVAPSRANGGAHCGAYVMQDLTLRHDIYGCVDGGLVVGRSGVTIDLNGHTIWGLGEGDGISLAGVSGVTVKNGSLVGFEVGLRMTGVSDSRVWDTRLRQSSDASVWLEGSTRNKFRRMTITENGDGGFRLIGSSHNRIAGNTISGASDSGIGLEELSNHNRLVRNRIKLAGEGIKLDGGSHNRIFRNATSWNGGAGIEVSAETLNTRINENDANHNGADGIYIEGLGSQVNRNEAGCNGGMGIKATVLAAGGENWAGGNGDDLGCVGVVCRLSATCGTESPE